MNRCRALLAGAALVTVSACTTPARPSADALPPRPTDIPIERVDPCALFDNGQQRALRLREERPTSPSVNGQPSRGCIWLTDSDLGYAAQTFPLAAELALTEPGSTAVSVNGFGAVRGIASETGAPTCQITVDAAPAGSIRIQVSGARKRSDDEMCRLATEAASMVMTTVVRTAG